MKKFSNNGKFLIRIEDTDRERWSQHAEDAIIEGLLSYQLSVEDLEKSGLPSKEITDTQHLIQRSEYKRFQFCPIIKLKNNYELTES